MKLKFGFTFLALMLASFGAHADDPLTITDAFSMNVYGAGPVVAEILRGITMMVQTDIFQSFFSLLAVCGFFATAVASTMGGKAKPEGVILYIVTILLINISLFQAKMDVYINDPLYNETASEDLSQPIFGNFDPNVANAPLAVVLPAVAVSTISSGLTAMLELQFMFSSSPTPFRIR